MYRTFGEVGEGTGDLSLAADDVLSRWSSEPTETSITEHRLLLSSEIAACVRTWVGRLGSLPNSQDRVNAVDQRFPAL
jgi:hypothetical protein